MKKISQTGLIIAAFIISGVLGLLLSIYMHPALTGDVQVIQTFHYPAVFVKQLAGDKEAGRKIFKEFCASCHAKEPTIDINAPRLGDQKEWAQRKKQGVAALLAVTIAGANAMPARGGCFECSDAQLRETILYMLEQS